MTLKVWVAVRDMQASRLEVEDDRNLDDLCKMVKDVIFPKFNWKISEYSSFV
jgi:hypothetical protein